MKFRMLMHAEQSCVKKTKPMVLYIVRSTLIHQFQRHGSKQPVVQHASFLFPVRFKVERLKCV